MPTKLELLAQLKKQATDLPYRDEKSLDALQRRADMLVRTIFGPEHKYLQSIANIRFNPSVYF